MPCDSSYFPVARDMHGRQITPAEKDSDCLRNSRLVIFFLIIGLSDESEIS
jgi:hypothetical protein